MSPPTARLNPNLPTMKQENRRMKHIHVLSRQRPAKAQFEPLLQLVGLLSAMLDLYEDFTGFLNSKNNPA
jgi:hypothetical protein